MFSLYFDLVILVISRFGFEGGIWVSVAQVPGHCILVTFVNTFISHCSGGFRRSSELPKHIILYIYGGDCENKRVKSTLYAFSNINPKSWIR